MECPVPRQAPAERERDMSKGQCFVGAPQIGFRWFSLWFPFKTRSPLFARGMTLGTLTKLQEMLGTRKVKSAHVAQHDKMLAIRAI